MKELLIGCGSSRVKKLHEPDNKNWNNLVTLDNNELHKPDVVWDLTKLPLPFDDNEFTEIHAYEVLEHTGAQGDYKFFFAQFSEFWRILENGGRLVVTCPSWKGEWAWGDPSHTRIIQAATLIFLNQEEYAKQVGVTPMSDFRDIFKADFNVIHCRENHQQLEFVLEAVKPSRISI
jgi:predicted SAM-dependent methyltransferase